MIQLNSQGKQKIVWDGEGAWKPIVNDWQSMFKEKWSEFEINSSCYRFKYSFTCFIV